MAMALRNSVRRLGLPPVMERTGAIDYRYFSNGVLIGRILSEEERVAANIYTQIIKKREEKGKPKNKEEKAKLKKKEEMEKEESEKKKYRRITQRCDSDRSWFSDNYYDKLVYQDVNLRSYFSSVRPPTKQTYGFRLGKCTIHHFPKRTSLHVFLPRRPQRMSNRSRPENANTWWWQLEKVEKLGFLQKIPDTEEQTK